MKQELYSEFVKRKFKTAAETRNDIVDKVSSHALQRLHAAMGIMTETLEARYSTDRKNLVEELGDLQFFLYAFGQATPEEFLPIIPLAPEPGSLGHKQLITSWDRLTMAAGELLDLSKREAIYAKALDNVRINARAAAYHQAIVHYQRVVTALGISFKEIEDHNRAKLDERYKAGYTNQEANDRADKKAGE